MTIDYVEKAKYLGIVIDNQLTFESHIYFHSSDGRVVRASATGAADSNSIPSRVKPMTLKLVFTASLLDVQH